MTQPPSRSMGFWEPIIPYDLALLEAFLAANRAEGLTARTDATRAGTWHSVTVSKPLPTVPPTLGPSNTGLDLSHWNNNDTALTVAQFNLIKAAGHVFVWIKRTQGLTFVDKHGLANFTAASQAGGLWIGSMHFFEWDKDGTEQIDHLSRTVGESVGNLWELLDVELEDGDVVTDKLLAEANLRKALARSEERFMRKPVIYTNANYWGRMFVASRVQDILQNYMFLIADWDGPLDQAPPGLPWVHFRQKSATYTIAGITGPIDLDEYRGLPPVGPPPPPEHTMRDKTHQSVLNAFGRAFGSVYWEVIVRAGLAGIASNRLAFYSGPSVEALPLTADEKGRLIAAL